MDAEMVRNARDSIGERSPYMGALIDELSPQLIDDEEHIAYTDGKAIYLNMDKILNDPSVGAPNVPPETKVEFVLLHEALHVAYSHFSRTGDRERGVWNVANDMVIDKDITLIDPYKYMAIAEAHQQAAGFDNQIVNLDMDVDNRMTSEEVYDVLYDKYDMGKLEKMLSGAIFAESRSGIDTTDGEIQSNATVAKAQGKAEKQAAKQKNAGKDPNEHGYGDEGTESEDQKGATVLTGTDEDAVMIAAGNLPGAVLRDITGKTDEQIRMNWVKILQKFFIQPQRDEGYVKADRRFEHVFLPEQLLQDDIQAATIVIDSSGSIDEGMLKTFINNIRILHGLYAHYDINVLVCDTMIHSDVSLKDFNSEKHIKGYGGTAFKPVLEHIEKMHKQPDVVVWFTDTFAWDIEEITEPKYPIIWAVPNSAWKQRWSRWGYCILVA